MVTDRVLEIEALGGFGGVRGGVGVELAHRLGGFGKVLSVVIIGGGFLWFCSDWTEVESMSERG